MRQPHDDYWCVRRSVMQKTKWVAYLMSPTGVSRTKHLPQRAYYFGSWQSAMDYVNCEIAIRI